MTDAERIAALVQLIEMAKAEVAFAALDEVEGTATYRTWIVRLKDIARTLEGVGDITARRALGFLPLEVEDQP